MSFDRTVLLFLSVNCRNLFICSTYLLKESGVISEYYLGQSSKMAAKSGPLMAFLSFSFLGLADLISPKFIAV